MKRDFESLDDGEGYNVNEWPANGLYLTSRVVSCDFRYQRSLARSKRKITTVTLCESDDHRLQQFKNVKL